MITRSDTNTRDDREPLTVGDRDYFVVTSAAQGGRLLASGADLARLSAGTWVSAGTASDPPIFLEQDTAYIRYQYQHKRTDVWLRIGSERPERVRSGRAITSGLPSAPGGGGMFGGADGSVPNDAAAISPMGDWIYLEWSSEYNDDCYSGTPYSGEYLYLLIPLGGGASQRLAARSSQSPPCSTPVPDYPPVTGPAGGVVAWRAGGNEFFYARIFFEGTPARLARYRFDGSEPREVASTTTTATRFDRLYWTPEGGRLLSTEFEPGPSRNQCFRRTRSANNPMSLILNVPDDACTVEPVTPMRQGVPDAIAAVGQRRPREPRSPQRSVPSSMPRALRVN